MNLRAESPRQLGFGGLVVSRDGLGLSIQTNLRAGLADRTSIPNFWILRFTGMLLSPLTFIIRSAVALESVAPYFSPYGGYQSQQCFGALSHYL